MALTLLPTAAMAEEDEAPAETKVAKVGETEYATLAEAVEKATDGATVTLLKNATGSGIIVQEGKKFTLDFGGHTYTVDQSPLAGSSGTQSQCFQLLKDSTLIFKNGTIACNNNGVAMIIQNYANLTLDGMTINGNTMSGTGTYAMSNNCGNVVIKDTTINAKNGDVAFDVYGGFGDYSDVTVTVEGNSVINGKIEVARDSGTQNKNTLNIKGGTINGALAVTENEKTTVTISGGTFNTDVSKFVADGYILNNGTVEKLGETNAVAKIGENYYGTFIDALRAATAEDTVTLLKDVELDTQIAITKKITLDLAGHTIKNGSTVKAESGLFVVDNEGDFTINDSSAEKTGMINAAAHGDNLWAAVLIWPDAGHTAKLTVNGGTLKGYSYPITGNGNCVEENCTTITINGGKLESVNGLAIYHPQNGKLTVNGGELIGQETAIEMRAGVLTINDGTFTATNKPTATQPNGSGTTTDGAAIAVCQHTTKLRTEVTINGGTFNGFSAFYEHNAQNNSTEDLAKVKLNITGGNFKTINGGTVAVYSADKTGFISGGLFSSEPAEKYIAENHYVDASNNGDYPYTVKEGTKPAGALIVVKDKTDTAVSGDITGDDKTAINNVIGKANVDGVAEAAKKADIVTKSGVTVAENDKVEIEVAVKVEAKAADLAKGQLTFEASPVATVKVNGAATGTTVPVTNAMLNGKPITVKLPLPTVDGKLFTPKQILHKFTGGGYEYFINETVGSKRGAGSFKIEGDCAVFTIYGFSTFELSGTVTYVEPSSGGGSSSSSRRYDVSAPSVKHGDVTVSPKSASKGDTVTITVKPDSGYELDTLTVKDASGSKIKVKDKGDGKFTFTMPASKVTVSAEFAEIETLDFADVSTDAYYYEAVKWAAKKGITGGTGDGTFNPNGSCTRAHIVTFLWRAAGSPEPKSTVSFADVPAGSYYAKAVAWAVENGITLGTGDGTFSPNATCTRAQSVTFLYRAMGTAPTTVNGFTDVTADAFYADAVAWAVESGVTNGTSASTFSPNNGCTRAQIVTFLYRTMK